MSLALLPTAPCRPTPHATPNNKITNTINPFINPPSSHRSATSNRSTLFREHALRVLDRQREQTRQRIDRVVSNPYILYEERERHSKRLRANEALL